MSCPDEMLAGSYVLGSLGSAERRDFERHLATCDECRRLVQEAAGIPGLLAKVPADVWETDAVGRESLPVPDTLLPALLREARQQRGRRTTLVALLAAAAAVVVVAGGFFAAGRIAHHHSGPGTSATVTAGSAMSPVGGQTAMSARLALQPVGWGTKVRLTCRYAEDDPRWEPSGNAVYSLLVTDRAGRVQRVATWKALPGKTMQVLGSTATASTDIASVEVRAANGATVLRLRS